MARQWIRAQQDLFEEAPPGLKLGAEGRRQALEQLQALLVEAMTTAEERMEADDEQDHA